MYSLSRLNLVIILLSTALFSCDAFNTRVPASEIKKATQWSQKDQFPSFPDCQGTTGDELVACFSTIVSEHIEGYLMNQSLIASAPINTTIELLLGVDKEGVINLKSFDDPDAIAQMISSFDALLLEAVASLPQALPAIKTNVGTAVAVELTLPINIVAQPEE